LLKLLTTTNAQTDEKIEITKQIGYFQQSDIWNILVGKTYWFYLTKSLQMHNNLKAEKIKNPGQEDYVLNSSPKRACYILKLQRKICKHSQGFGKTGRCNPMNGQENLKKGR